MRAQRSPLAVGMIEVKIAAIAHPKPFHHCSTADIVTPGDCRTSSSGRFAKPHWQRPAPLRWQSQPPTIAQAASRSRPYPPRGPCLHGSRRTSRSTGRRFGVLAPRNNAHVLLHLSAPNARRGGVHFKRRTDRRHDLRVAARSPETAQHPRRATIASSAARFRSCVQQPRDVQRMIGQHSRRPGAADAAGFEHQRVRSPAPAAAAASMSHIRPTPDTHRPAPQMILHRADDVG